MVEKGISLVIFCYNSEKRIWETLKHIVNQKLSKDILWEVIAVDNNSSDRTLEVIENALRSLSFNAPFHIVSEEKQGLSYARMKGIETARFEIVAFVDDDNRLFEDWVQNAYDFMTHNPEVGLCGGQTFPHYETDPEPWFDRVKHTIAIGEQGKSVEDITDTRKFVWGAGALIRKPIIIKAIELGFNNITKSRVPNFLGGGDDYELACVIRAMKAKIYYNEHLKLFHYIPVSRTTWQYIRKNAQGYGYSSLLFDVYEWYIKGKNLNLPVFLLWLRQMVSLIRSLIKYGFSLMFINSYSKGNPRAMKLEYIKGRLKAFFTTSFTSYSQSVTAMRSFFTKKDKYFKERYCAINLIL